MSGDVSELLPFYANGTLDEAEKTVVERALAQDASLRDELAFLQRLRSDVKAQDAGHSPGELGWKRLQKSLRQDTNAHDPIARARSAIAREQNNIWRLAAIAACLLLVLQTVIAFPAWRQGDLTAAGGGAFSSAHGHALTVTFVPQATEANIRALLLAVDARIVDGPSALGVYTLSVTGNPEAAAEKLRAHSNLVETVGREDGAEVRP